MNLSEEQELVGRLIEALTLTENLLNKHEGPNGWATRLNAIRRAILQGDEDSLLQLRHSFGGMGSLSDLILCKENGHAIDQPEVAEANENLQTLLLDVSSLSRRVTRPMLRRTQS